MVESLLLPISVVAVTAAMANWICAMRRAKGEIESLLHCWLQENELTLLKYRRWFNIEISMEENQCKVCYRVTVVDRDGIRWKGLAAVVCRLGCRELVPLRVQLRD